MNKWLWGRTAVHDLCPSSHGRVGVDRRSVTCEWKDSRIYIWGPINYQTWDTCVEKANTDIEGSYAMINYEYANHIGEQYMYINREEDLGLEGLRKAKLSYQPTILLEKCIAELNDHKG